MSFENLNLYSLFRIYLETKVQSVAKMEGILSSSGRMSHHVVRYKLFTFLLGFLSIKVLTGRWNERKFSQVH